MHLVSQVNSKFFYDKTRFSLAELSRTWQYEDLDVYIRRFHERALNCYDPMDKEVIVNVWPFKLMDKLCLLLIL